MKLSFSATSSSRFGPRTGTINLASICINTPGLMVATSRGVVSHIGHDQYSRTPALRCVSVPFESFLENSPPTPTLQKGSNPLHAFLMFKPSQNLLVMTLRDPANANETPSNGNNYISASTSRGIKKITPAQYRDYVHKCAPDVAVAFPDIPWTLPPFSQKRITKSIDRTATWLAGLLAPPVPDRLSILEAETVHPYKCLDDGVAGYVFDLVPLRKELEASPHEGRDDQQETTALLKASLMSARSAKLRVVNSPVSPHEILRLIRDVGVDIFDAKWAQDAAQVGVALDFVFPVPSEAAMGKRRDLGHNLYSTDYAHDFSPFADGLLDCPCDSCAPPALAQVLQHSALDPQPSTYAPAPYTRAYVHHLLNTHEMSAHSLLVRHNLAVVDTFFAGVRDVLGRGEDLSAHVDRFISEYDETLKVIDEGRVMWKDVDVARGKGRLARERESDSVIVDDN
ncbi:tRNA-guanine(15) transglycosylase-like protein [Mycena galopus ATCC 62051]|nr:tRNA-guanine(15) transglycosylase-like protein [Mycena galopus ATCC 62051]